MITINKQKLYKSFISIGRSTRKKRLIYEKFRTRQQFSLFRIVNCTDDEKRKQTFAHACVSSGDPLRIFCILKQFVNLDCCRYQISFGYVLIKECLELSRVIAHVSLLDYWNKKPYTGLCGFFRTFSGMAAKTRCRNLAPTHSYFDWHKKLLLLPRKKPLERLDYIGTSFGVTGRGLHYNLKKNRTGYY